MTALIIILVMIGLNFYPKISIDLLPNMEIPTVLVRCEYQGASPTEIEVEIAKRIEDAVSSLDGIRHITSVSIEDEARIQLEFNMGTNVDIAATDIREALNRIRADLPDGADGSIALVSERTLNAVVIVPAKIEIGIGVAKGRGHLLSRHGGAQIADRRGRTVSAKDACIAKAQGKRFGASEDKAAHIVRKPTVRPGIPQAPWAPRAAVEVVVAENAQRGYLPQ